MRIGHTADFHIGCLKTMYPQGYLDRARDMLAELSESLLEQKIQILVVSGDIFEKYAPTDDERTLFNDFLVQCAKADYPQHTVILPGNHDAERDYMGALTSLQKITEHFIPRISLYTDLTALDIIFDSYPEFSEFSNTDTAPSGEFRLKKVDPTSISKYSRILMLPDEYIPLLKKISRIINRSEEIEGEQENHLYTALKQAHIVISHYAATGSVFETGTTGGSVDVPYAHFRNTRLWCLGDIHKMQQIHRNPDVWYCGTPYQKNFGEQLPKGYLIHDLNEHGVDTQFTDLSRATQLITYDLPTTVDEFREILRCSEHPVNSGLVKYRYRNTAFEDMRLPGNFIVPEFVPVQYDSPKTEANTVSTQAFDEGFELGLDLFDGIDAVIVAYCPEDRTLIPEIRQTAFDLRKELGL